MLRTRIPIQTAGVYIYRAKKQVWIDEVNRELIIVLCCPSESMVGVVAYPDSFVTSQLFELLTSLKQKFCNELAIPAEKISAKIFGCSGGATNALFAAQVWLSDQGFIVGGMDTGRNVTRSLVIDCTTAKVGVRFADAESALGTGFLKTGTAAARLTRATTSGYAILVTDHRIFGFLGKQSLESDRHWKAEKVTTKEFLQASKKGKEKWIGIATAIVLFDDILKTPKLSQSILALRKKMPQATWMWSVPDGTEVPLPMESLHLPTSEKPSLFLEEVTKIVSAPKPPLATVIELPKKRSSR